MNWAMDTCTTCGATLPAMAEHCPKCGAVVAPGTVVPAPVVSLTRSGPYQFGLVGKLVWTALFVSVGLGLYGGAIAAGKAFGTPGLALILFLLGIFVVVGAIFLWGVWRPTRVA